MWTTIRARVTGGKLEPVDKVELPEGKEVLVTIVNVPSDTDYDAFRCAAGGWKGTIDVEALLRNIYSDRLVSTRSIPRI